MLFLREVEAAFLEQVPQHVKVESYVFLPLALVDEPAFFEVAKRSGMARSTFRIRVKSFKKYCP